MRFDYWSPVFGGWLRNVPADSRGANSGGGGGYELLNLF